MKKLWITFMITAASGYIIGMNLLNPINTSVSVIVTPAYNKSVVSVAGILPIVAVIILIIDSILGIDDHREG
jgi:hypothetical protein